VLLDAPTADTITPEGVHISDFGLIYYHKYKTATTRSNIVGSPPYLAPEVLIYGESSITPSSDIWAAGCIGFELCNGEKLNDAHGTHPVEAYLKNLRSERVRELSDVPSRFSNFVRSVLKRCLEFESSNRPTATEMRDHLLSDVQAWARITLETPSTLPSNPLTTISPSDNTLAQPPQEENDIADDEWLSVSHNDAIPNHDGSVSATGCKSINPTPTVNELTRQFESQVSMDDKQEEDDFSWTTGEEKSISHTKLIDRGGSGEVHEVSYMWTDLANL
jgi:serine/threonine protein kinase